MPRRIFDEQQFPSGGLRLSRRPTRDRPTATTAAAVEVFGRRISRLINCQQGFLISDRDFRINHPGREASR